jgi:predicted DNA-binding transcriptional regulator AlpA
MALYSAAELAEMLHVKESTLYSWRKARRGEGPPAVNLAGRLVYRSEDVDRWLAALPSTVDASRRSHVRRGQVEQR